MCACNNPIDTAETETETQNIINLELEQLLIHELLIQVVRYFCKVHLNEQVTKLKDYMLEVTKTYQHRHTVDSIQSKSAAKASSDFPCGVCGQECIEILHESEASIEQFSVQCDKCHKWFHYPCMQLTGNEPELQENSELPFYCTQCVTTDDQQRHSISPEDDITDEVLSSISDHVEPSTSASTSKKTNKKGYGCGRGRGRGKRRGDGHVDCQKSEKQLNVKTKSKGQAPVTTRRDTCTSTEGNQAKDTVQETTTSVTRSGRIRKSVTKMNL